MINEYKLQSQNKLNLNYQILLYDNRFPSSTINTHVWEKYCNISFYFKSLQQNLTLRKEKYLQTF